MLLPPDHFPYTDIYFFRSLEILKQEKLNPWIRTQVFLRGKPGRIYGLSTIIEIINKFSRLFDLGGKVFSLLDGDDYQPNETVLIIEGPVQEIITLETIILGTLSAMTTWQNDHIQPDLAQVKSNMEQIVETVAGRPVFYFGSRHWDWQLDSALSQAAAAGGASGCSTPNGATFFGNNAVGTIPHALEAIFAWKDGFVNCVTATTVAFDKWISQEIPRIALVDFNNHEIDDAVAVGKKLGSKLSGIRIDTCGENLMQGSSQERGVNIEGVTAVRLALNAAKLNSLKITLSSGFANIAKIEQFIAAEKQLGYKLFDSLGVGELFPSRISTMDIVAVGENELQLRPVAKVGRCFKPNPRLKQRQ